MALLAVDGATPVAGVAWVEQGEVRAEIFLNNGLGHARTLMVLVDQVLKLTEHTPHDIDALAVTLGPGSFTGLRIAMATVKGLAMALDKPVIGVSTLKVLASAVEAAPALIVPVLNARKGEVYAALYSGGWEGVRQVTEEMAINPVELAGLIRREIQRNGHSRVLITGDGVKPYHEVWERELSGLMLSAPPFNDRPRAGVLGVLAWEMYREGCFLDPLNLVPTYLRMSEAELKLDLADRG